MEVMDSDDAVVEGCHQRRLRGRLVSVEPQQSKIVGLRAKEGLNDEMAV